MNLLATKKVLILLSSWVAMTAWLTLATGVVIGVWIWDGKGTGTMYLVGGLLISIIIGYVLGLVTNDYRYILRGGVISGALVTPLFFMGHGFGEIWLLMSVIIIVLATAIIAGIYIPRHPLF